MSLSKRELHPYFAVTTKRYMTLVGLFAVLLSGCDGVTGSGQQAIYHVSSEKEVSPSDADMQVLINRFRTLPGSLSTRVKASEREGQSYIIVENAAFADPVAKCVARHVGKMEIYSIDPAAAWLGQSDVERVEADENEGYYFLNFSIDDGAVERFTRLTSEHVGERLTVSVDNEVITKAQIQAALGKRFRLTIDEKGQAQCLAAVLSNGMLSQSYRLVRQP